MEYKSKKAAAAAERAGRTCKECKRKKKESRVFTRACPVCYDVLEYKRKQDMQRLKDVGSPCRTCACKEKRSDNFSGLTRKCPGCLKILKYSSADSATRANKSGTMCKPCINKDKIPSPQCMVAVKKANTGRAQSKEHVEKRRKSILSRYGSKSYLGSDQHKKFMQDNGFWTSLDGKTISSIIDKYDVPKSSIYKWVNQESIENIDKVEDFCKEYKKYNSSLELITSRKLNISFYNKKCHNNLRYRPDFKLSDKIFLNSDGLYWHSEIVKENKYYHFNMRKDYENLNLRIFQFRDDEINQKSNIVTSMIDNILKNTKNKIGARKCKISQVNTSDAMLFLNENHIKGYIHSNHIGLYYNDNLVSIISYKLGRSKKSRFIKIDRFCSRVNWNIMGGFSRLIKNVQSQLPDLPVHYWVDLRYGTGTFLINQDFRLEKETLGWEWTDFKTTYNRLRCRANMDDRRLSEADYANERKWSKIYDAGQRLYIKSNQ
jgi:hypothetical protein